MMWIKRLTIACLIVLVSASAIDQEKLTKAINEYLKGDVPEAPEADTMWAEACCPGLGCFDNGGVWISGTRPFNLAPKCQDEIGTQFWLYTRKNYGEGNEHVLEYGNIALLQASNFDPAKETKFLIHGWTHDIHEDWAQFMISKFLNYGDYNVIAVDWRAGAKMVYSQSTANTRVVGAQIAQLVDWLSAQTGISNSQVHIIGHSLGAHTAGYAGERLPGLARITGLDPAGPYFESTDPVVRLDPTDATFVDAIHTDTSPIYLLGLGIKQPVASVDFYPNGGVLQPGCDDLFEMLWDMLWDLITGDLLGIILAFSCNHMRACDFYTDSITIYNNCPYTGYPCSNYDDFDVGKCGSCSHGQCSSMGFHADKYTNGRGSLYLSTGDSPSYCHFSVNFEIYTSSMSEKVSGRIKATIYGSSGNSPSMQTVSHQEMRPGNMHTGRLTTDNDWGDILKMEVSYEDTSWGIFTDTWTAGDFYVRKGNPETVYKLCGHDQRVKSGNTITIWPCL